MEIHNNDITCYRGESFTLDFDIRNQDGSPFVLWSGYSGYDTYETRELEQMFILFTISDDKGDRDNTIKRYWLDCNIADDELDNLFPRFDYTRIHELPSSLVTLDNGKYKGTLPTGHHARTCVYKLQDTDKYLYVKSIDEENICTFEEYRLRITIPFMTNDTESLVKMNYSYNLLLTDNKLSNYNILGVLLSPHKFTVLNAYRR